MDITVTVTDGFHGKPAEGVDVCISGVVDDIAEERTESRTNGSGQVTYTAGNLTAMCGGVFQVEINVDTYFAALGVTPWNKKLVVYFRVTDVRDKYDIMSLITPYTLAMYCSR